MSRSARCACAEEPQGEAKANDCPGRGAGAGPWAERRIPAWPYGRRSHSTVLSSGRSSRPHAHTHTHADAPPHAHAHTPSHAHAHARGNSLTTATLPVSPLRPRRCLPQTPVHLMQFC